MRLIIEDLEGSTTVVPLGSEEVTIGRKEHNTIQLTEQNVSRSHAKLHFRDEGWIIEDLGSYNGVKVNGVPIAEPTALHESDLIQIGDYHLTLTDQVDRATVDIERPRAANDGMQPAMGSSSSDLPSMSVEDLEPMRPAPAGAAGPAGGAAALGYQQAPPAQDDDNKGKAGLIVGAVLGLIAIIVLAVWLANTGDKGETEVADSSAEQGKTPEADAGQAEADAGAAQADADAGAGADADAGALAEAGAETGEVLVEDTGTDTGGELIEDAAETGELIEDAGETGEAVEEVDPEPKPKPKNRNKPKPKPQPKPDVDPAQALKDARQAMIGGNNRKAYNLAKDAYQAGAGNDALSLMGVTACKMGSKTKAKGAYRKLPGSKKDDLAKVCNSLGITLD